MFYGTTVDVNPSPLTPLQQILGFDASEEVYDKLSFRDQLILDLMIQGWTHRDIGRVMGLSQGWITVLLKRIRMQLAGSQLRYTLEIRQHYKEINPIINSAHPDRYETEE